MKKESKHTPGPWEISYADKFNITVTPKSNRSNPICKVNTNFDESTANAHVVKAAPDMLAALKRVKSWIDYGKVEYSSSLYDAIESAIFKAEPK